MKMVVLQRLCQINKFGFLKFQSLSMPPILPRLFLNSIANLIANPLLRQSAAPAAVIPQATTVTASSKNLKIQHQVDQMKWANHHPNSQPRTHQHSNAHTGQVFISQTSEADSAVMPIPKSVAPSLFHLPEQTRVAIRRQSWHDEPIFIDLEEVQI
jgi:hypothetical protein